jgi:2-C-methyl-D-erythritol 4-phosphate cytidylyltransferase
MNKYAIIVAGGSGVRMATQLPKQFLLLCGKPILMRTIEAFHQFDNDVKIILVLPNTQFKYWADLCKEFWFQIQHTVVAGGDTRFQSVSKGLESITDIESSIIGIHDGVRPMVSVDTLQVCYDTASHLGNAIPCVSLNDSLREVNGVNSKHVNRELYKAVQTPQVFKLGLLQKAYKQKYNSLFTDDASVVEAIGEKINIVEGNRENLKITTPADLIIAEAFLKNQLAE